MVIKNTNSVYPNKNSLFYYSPLGKQSVVYVKKKGLKMANKKYYMITKICRLKTSKVKKVK